MERQGVYEVTPSSTNVRELAPPKSDIPSILLIQSITVEYTEEYIIVEPMDYCRTLARMLEAVELGAL